MPGQPESFTNRINEINGDSVARYPSEEPLLHTSSDMQLSKISQVSNIIRSNANQE
jgi:hypothetical protein